MGETNYGMSYGTGNTSYRNYGAKPNNAMNMAWQSSLKTDPAIGGGQDALSALLGSMSGGNEMKAEPFAGSVETPGVMDNIGKGVGTAVDLGNLFIAFQQYGALQDKFKADEQFRQEETGRQVATVNQGYRYNNEASNYFNGTNDAAFQLKA